MKARLPAALLVLLMMLSTAPLVAGQADVPDVRISEVLVSASSEDYDGVDWNGDGYFGSSSDQFIEIWNAGSTPVDVSDWWLDDEEGGGSPPCRLPWDTVLQPNARVVIFRADSGIELDYYGGDSAVLRTAEGAHVDSMSWPDKDSWWDRPYIPLANGTLWKDDAPTPGSHENATVTAPIAGLRCYTALDHLHSGAYVLTGRVVTMDDAGTVHNDGSILVEDGVIVEVWNGDAPSDLTLEGVPVHHTDATIYPGLLDLHNHLHYNTAPVWPVENHMSSPNEWGGYQNRYQWKNHPDYSEFVTKPKMLLHGGPYFNLEFAAMKYVEAKVIVGGTTASQGAPSNPDDAYASVLARNIEDWNFGRDEIHTKVTELESDYIGNHIKTGNASQELDAWFLHLGEGVDESSRAEFDILVANDLLVGELVLIHGTALTATEFQKMGQVGASLVWSPLSNLLLYGDTTDVAAAKAAGVNIALAPDWSPSGSKSPLHELKIADLWDDEMLGDIFTDEEMVRMVTSNAADATNWQENVGRIAPGMAADLAVIDTNELDPYRNLIDAVDPDVRLTVIGGMALYGDADLMQAMRGDDHEAAGMFGKRIDVTASGVEDGLRSWSSIVENLTEAAAFEPAVMEATFGEVDGFDSLTANVGHGGLDPWWTYEDPQYFQTLNGSTSGNAQVDLSLVYDRYYDRGASMVAVDLGNTSTWQAKGTSASTGGSNDGNTDNGDNTGTGDTSDGGNDGTTDNGDGNNDGTITPTDPCADGLGLGCDGTDSSSDDETASGGDGAPMGLIGLGVLVVVAAGVFVMRRRDEDIDLTAQDALFDEEDLIEEETTVIEELDDEEKDVVDIPAPPPPGGPPA